MPATKHLLKESLLTVVTKLMSSLVPKSPLALKAVGKKIIITF